MKLSELDTATLAEYLREEEDETLLPAILAAGKAYTLGRTGLSAEEADEFEDLTFAAMMLCATLWDRRTSSLDSYQASENPAYEAIVGLHTVNFLGTVTDDEQ